MAEELKPDLTQEELDEPEKKFDSSLVTRENGAGLKQVLYYIAIVFAFYTRSHWNSDKGVD